MQLTAVILTKNVENTIADCIESLLFCDQILVIDDESTDRTIEIIEKMNNPKVHVRVHPLDNNFAKQRNYAMTQATGEWVLFVDADERVPEALASEIKNAINQESSLYEGYYIRRDDYLWGEKMQKGETGNIKLLRLGKRTKGKWKGRVHETWEIKGNKGVLHTPLIHYPHQNLSEFLREVNHYSTLRAEELFEKKVHSNFVLIIMYPTAKFIKNYFFLSGFKDGIPGFIHAVVMSFHSFLVRGKLFLLWKGIKNT